ncbi:MAG: hypothetical protein K1X74_21920, partial [Pirellulales bacterium]|nr:hypothetical protein [Pirellulales bacterium]
MSIRLSVISFTVDSLSMPVLAAIRAQVAISQQIALAVTGRFAACQSPFESPDCGQQLPGWPKYELAKPATFLNWMLRREKMPNSWHRSRNPPELLAAGLDFAKSRGERTPVELFRDGIRNEIHCSASPLVRWLAPSRTNTHRQNDP